MDTGVVPTSWLLWIVAAVSMGCMNLSESLLSVLLDMFQAVRFPDYMAIHFLILRGTTVLFPTVVAPFHNPASSWFQFLHIFINTCYFLVFFFHHNESEIIVHCGFDMQFSDDSNVEHLFIWSWASLEKCLFKSFAPFFELFDFLLLSYKYSLYILNTSPLLDIWFTHIFSHSVGCLSLCWLCRLMLKSFWVWYYAICLFFLFACALGVMSKKSLLSLMPWKLFS